MHAIRLLAPVCVCRCQALFESKCMAGSVPSSWYDRLALSFCFCIVACTLFLCHVFCDLRETFWNVFVHSYRLPRRPFRNVSITFSSCPTTTTRNRRRLSFPTLPNRSLDGVHQSTVLIGDFSVAFVVMFSVGGVVTTSTCPSMQTSH